MTTVIEDNQLSTELQELYLISKHWISDLEFFDKDLQIVEKLFGGTFSGLTKQEGSENIAILKLNIATLEHKGNGIKASVLNYMHSLEPLIANTSGHFDLSLVETHSQLEIEIGELVHSFQAIKQQIFRLTSEEIKSNHTNHKLET